MERVIFLVESPKIKLFILIHEHFCRSDITKRRYSLAFCPGGGRIIAVESVIPLFIGDSKQQALVLLLYHTHITVLCNFFRKRNLFFHVTAFGRLTSRRSALRGLGRCSGAGLCPG